MSLHLPVDMYAPDHLSAALAELRAYSGSVRDARVRAKAAHTDTAKLLAMTELLANLLRASGIDPQDTQKLETAYKELDKILQAAPVMHITLAASAGRTLKRQLTVWFRTQIHPHSLLTFAARSDIGGGFMLQTGSRFYDFSFRDRLLARKHQLMEIASVR